jgi:hypothetical protein
MDAELLGSKTSLGQGFMSFTPTLPLKSGAWDLLALGMILDPKCSSLTLKKQPVTQTDKAFGAVS